MSKSKIKAQKQLIPAIKLYNYLQSGFPQLDPNNSVLKNRPEISKLYEKFLNANTKISIDLDHYALAMMKQKASNKWSDKQKQSAKHIQDKAQAKLAEKQLQKRRKKYAKKRKYIEMMTHDQNPESYLQTYRKYLQEAARVKTNSSLQKQKALSNQFAQKKENSNRKIQPYFKTFIIKTKTKTEQNYCSQKIKKNNKVEQMTRAKTHDQSRKKDTFLTLNIEKPNQVYQDKFESLPIGIPKERYQMLKNHPNIIAFTLQRIKTTQQNEHFQTNTIKIKTLSTNRKRRNFTLDYQKDTSQRKQNQKFIQKALKLNNENLIKNHIQKIYLGRKRDYSGRNIAMRREMQREMKTQKRQKGQKSKMNEKCLDVKIQTKAFQGLKKIQKFFLLDQLKHLGVHLQENEDRKKVVKSLDK